uniref:HYPK_UBA domain-containing protein n=1 Tax=Syphacia muris TaxID=451379 RepID=A0A0N5AI84_9BILA
MSDQEEDPYAVSSDSEDELQGPPPKINIEGRAVADLSSIKAAFTEAKADGPNAVVDEARAEELKELAAKKELSKLKKELLEGNFGHILKIFVLRFKIR